MFAIVGSRHVLVRALVVALFAVPLLTTLAALPAARAVQPRPAVPHVEASATVSTHAAQGALSAAVPGSLPKAAGSQRAGALLATPKPPPSCADRVKSQLLAGGYSSKLLGLTTSGGEKAVLKQITAGCSARQSDEQVGVQSLFNARKPAVDASNFMFWGRFTPAGPASQVLKKVGYGPSPIALSMKFTYMLDPQPTAKVLKDLGFSATQDMQALKDVFSLAAGPNSQILKNIGYPASSNMQALKDVFKTTAGPASKIIFNDGYTSSQNAKALIDVFKTKAADGAKYLTADGYSAKDIGIALRDVFKVDAKGMAQLLKSNGFNANDTSASLRDLYGKNGPSSAIILAQVGYDADAIGGAMKTVFSLTSSQTVGALKGAGFIQTKIAQVVKPLYAITVPSDLSVAMLGGPFGSCDVAKGVAAVFTLSGADMTTALKAAFSAANDVATGLNCVMPGFNAAYAAQLLQGGGFPIGATVGAIRFVLNPDATTTTGAVKPYYPAINDVADTIKSSYVLGNPDLTKVMKGGGYGAPDLGALLHDHFNLSPADGVDAFSFAGFGGSPTAGALLDKFGVTDPATALSLMKSKYSIGEIASGLQGPYQITQAKKMAELFINNFDPEVIANTLGQVYNLAIPETVKAMFDASYPADLVSRALDKYPTPQDFTNIPKLLSDAGYDPTAIGKTIKSYFDKPANIAAQYMTQFGAGAGVVAQVLSGDYQLDANNAALILAGAGFPMAAILPVLGSVFGVAAGAVKGILEFAGFDPEAIDDFFDTIDDITCALNPFC